MSNIVINDLEMNQDLDKHAAIRITGGWIRRTYSTADLHKAIYGTGSPYGRNPNAAPFNQFRPSYSWGF